MPTPTCSERSSRESARRVQLLATARGLLAKGGALQSTQSGERIEERAISRAVEQFLRNSLSVTPASPAGVAARAASTDIVSKGQSALDRTAGGTPAGNLSDLEVSALEVIVQVMGRPALRYIDGRVETPPEELGDNEKWIVFVATERSKIQKCSTSVGRVALGGLGTSAEHLGTGWRLGRELLVTNRHIAKELVRDPSASPSTWQIDPAKPAFVDFGFTHGRAGGPLFGIRELVHCAEEPAVDIAVLRLEPGAAPFPPPLSIEWSPHALGREIIAGSAANPEFQGKPVYVVGHPLRHWETDASSRVYGHADGRKRCSPGYVTTVSVSRPELEHDCSTLGGNSGSCVISCGLHAVVGVHLGGRDANAARATGLANVAVAISGLGNSLLSAALRAAAEEGNAP